MRDERILGSGDFVSDIYTQIEETSKVRGQVLTEETLLTKICSYYKVEVNDVYGRPTKKVRSARSVYVYFGKKILGKSMIELGKRLRTSYNAASMAYSRGKEIVKELGAEEMMLNDLTY